MQTAPTNAPGTCARTPSGTDGPRILYVIGNLIHGGAEIHLSQICPRLRDRGFRPEIFLLGREGELVDEVRNAGIPVHEAFYRLPPSPGIFRRLIRLGTVTAQLWVFLMRQRFDVVHFFLPTSYVVGAPVALLSGHRRLVMSRRSMNNYQADFRALGWAERLLHRTGVSILGNSRCVVTQLRNEERIPDQRLGLIYNGIDVGSFEMAPSRRAVRERLGIADDALVLSVVANLIPYKGHADLLEALGAVREALPAGWRLLVIGRDDGIGDDLQAVAARTGIADNVLFLGGRSDVTALQKASDIGILCSHQEGFSNALIEGMAAGLPMIATAVGGNGEAVLDGVTGLIVPPKDPDALGAAILSLATNEAERESMAKEALQRVRDHFSIERCVENYACFYRAFVQGVDAGEIPGIRARDFETAPGTYARSKINAATGS